MIIALVLAGLFAPAPVAAAPPRVPPGAVVGSGGEHKIGLQGIYEYESHDALLGMPQPSAADLAKIGTSKDYESGTWQHMYAAWKEYIAAPPGWEEWRAMYGRVVHDDPAKLGNVPQPSAALMAEVKPSEQYQYGSTFFMLARWKEYQAAVEAMPAADYEVWRRQYVTLRNSNSKGGGSNRKYGFEPLYRAEAIEKDPVLSKGDWKYGKHMPKHLKAKLGSKLHIVDRPLDAVDLTKLKMILELKSGNSINSTDGRKQLEDLITIAKETGCRLYYVFAEMPDAASIALIRRMSIEHGIAIDIVYWPAMGSPVMPDSWGGTPPPTQGTSGGTVTSPGPSGPKGGPAGGAATPLTAPGQHAADSPVLDAAANAPGSAGEAITQGLARQRIGAQIASAGGDVSVATLPDLGGVDFSTLELRYVSDTYHNGSGVQYAFRADGMPADQRSFGGRRAAQLASDSFFVWLALPPYSFTVNLNPDEPNRIIDDKFGRTDAGRVLLEADLTMKKSVAKFIHPDAPGADGYWSALQGESKCLSMRQWIVPATATVHDNDDELYILDAPLEVKMESTYFKASGAANGCDGKQDASVTKHNEEVYRTRILPKVQEAVNKAPEYADLRRVYASRVAAEWFRQRSRTKPTAFTGLIDKGDISRWASREQWTPRQVFDRYVESYTKGEFNITRQSTEGDYIYTRTFVYGGVDFSRIDRTGVGAQAFARDHPGMANAATGAMLGRTAQGKTVWMGGQTTAKPLREAFARPSPATSSPWFYALVALPLITWLAAGGYLLRRRMRTVSP
ncbi:hypothetical protein [Longispora albida]|uniref:hypothetical protein n=1 Tax=Longispora albida TaxID=203523 RepID=UPI0012FC2042|nr:hypothetical protein [Longispora albida]